MQLRGLSEAANPRRGQTAALALSALCVNLLLSNAHGAACVIDDLLPCSFGDCEFFKDASGILNRTGSCLTKNGALWLAFKGITGLRAGVFSNMDACEYLFLRDNLLTDLPATPFNGFTNLKLLALNGKQAH